MTNFEIHHREIYTTGAYLTPVKYLDETGHEHWGWIVSKFEEPCFEDGEEIVAVSYSDSLENLTLPIESE